MIYVIRQTPIGQTTSSAHVAYADTTDYAEATEMCDTLNALYPAGPMAWIDSGKSWAEINTRARSEAAA